MKTILFQTGGPFHPVEAQAKLIQSSLPSDWKIKPAFGTEAFELLADADLYVAGGLHWTVLSDLSALIGSDPEPPIWESAQIEKHPYIPPTEAQKSEFRKYVQSGRPILAFHSGILSYDDWPEYGQLLGFRWQMGITDHTLCAGWKHFSVPYKTGNSEELLRELRPELVSICTYLGSRPALVEASVRNGAKAIWCEKPLSLTIQEGRRLVELCEENGVKLVINHYRRYLDLWNRVKQLVKDREIGDLEFIVGSFEGWDQMEMGTHLLDMMRYILDDEPVSWVMGQVRCTGAKRSYGHVMEEHSACYFAFKNG